MQRKYEVLYILKPDLDEAGYTAALSKLEHIIQESGGQVLNLDDWGMKPLAYEMDHRDKGYYVRMEFQADVAIISKLDERFRLDETVLRHQITRR